MEEKETSNNRLPSPLTVYALSTAPNDISPLLQRSVDPLESAKALLLQICWRLEYHKNYVCECDPENGQQGMGMKEYRNWLENEVISPPNFKKLLSFMQTVKSKVAKHADLIAQLDKDAEEFYKEYNEESRKRKQAGGDGDGDNIGENCPRTIFGHQINPGSSCEHVKCPECGSKNIKFTNSNSKDEGHDQHHNKKSKPRPEKDAISHSASIDSLIQLFAYRLPSLSDKSVLDIGSGLGGILFACCVLSEAKSVGGIELNGPFCRIVEKVAKIFALSERITVIEGDLRDHAEALRTHDVVIFNNSFEYFLPLEMQIELWTLIRESMKSGALLVTNPDLNTALRKLGPGLKFKVEEWVQDFKSETDPNLLLAMEKVDENFWVYLVK